MMENLELQEQIINLGKQFVTELGLEPGVDTFSKWMAHYIAEKVTLAQQLPNGNDKIEAEKECFETILKLWEHRWTLPFGKQPLRQFTPILKTLVKLRPEKKESFFYDSFDHELSELEKDNPDLKEITKYTNLALQIDKVARIWINFVLKNAALKATSEKFETLLKNVINLRNNDDILTIKILLENEYSLDSENINNDDIHKKQCLELLNRRIEELEKFSNLNDSLLEYYREEMKNI